jgi:anaerobic selenocysteine-containing dehydrogenase
MEDFMIEQKSKKLSRRGFLKASGAAAALAFLGDLMMDKPNQSPFALASEASSQEGVEWVYSWCRQCALPPCGIKVKVENGIATQVTGDPQCPANQGKLCSRGASTLMSVYNPYRVKTPLKRTNPNKGLNEDPGWVEISWEEALNSIETEMRRVQMDDPRKFIWNNGFARSGSMLEGMEFCEAFGTPNYIEVDGPNCSVHFGASLLLGNFTGPGYDPNYTDYLILIGQGSTASQGYVNSGSAFASAVARGMKVVTIDPHCNVEASKGEWIPIRPGTDLAFVLAMQNVMLYELQRFDVTFIKQRTNGPYLIGPDGHYLRDAETNKPLMWDPEDGQAKVFDDPSFKDYALEGEFEVNGTTGHPGFQVYKESIASYTPEWAEEKTSIPAATIRRITKEFVDAAQIGSTIMIEGTPFPYRPVCLESGRGAITQYYGGVYHCASIMVNMLVGALDVPGGGSGSVGPPHKSTPVPMALMPDEDGVIQPKVEARPRPFIYPPDHIDGKTFFPFSHDCPHIVFHAITHLDEHAIEYQPEVMFIWGGNAVLRMYEPEKVIDAMKTFKFIYALSYSVDEPTLMADIVLPESAGLERYASGTRGAVISTPEGKRNAVYALAAQQVIQPVYDSRQPDEVFIELGRRLGILFGEGGMNDLLNSGQYAPYRIGEPYLLDLNKAYTPKELTDLALKTAAGDEASVDGLRNQSSCVISKMLPLKTTYPYLGFPMGQTRYAVYMDYLKRQGEELRANLEQAGAEPPGWSIDKMMEFYTPVVKWIDPPHDAPAEFDLYGVNWKTPQFSFGVGGSAENPWLHEAAKMDPYLHYVCMNRKTAQERGLKDGDMVWVESGYGGRVKGPLKLTETMHPETVGISGLFGHQSKQMNPIALKGIHFNSLMSSEPDDIDPISGGFNGAPKVKVYKA